MRYNNGDYFTHKIKSRVIPGFVWNIMVTDFFPSSDDIAFIETFSPIIYHNDIDCYLWAFDKKLPSGAWLENMRFKSDMKSATAGYYKEV